MKYKIIFGLSLFFVFLNCYSQLLYPTPTEFMEIEKQIEKVKSERKLNYDFPMKGAFFIDTTFINFLYTVDSIKTKNLLYDLEKDEFSNSFWIKEYKLVKPLDNISALYSEKSILEKEIIEKLLGYSENEYTFKEYIYSNELNKAFVMIARNGFAGYRFTLIDNQAIKIEYVFSIIH